ncbi:MAG: 4Fe-4S ferredoxin [Candidatus Rokuibacteriota bacterium]|nr:MAG: 4Fe-4S ferredoxin [Candidatus Rokubacteria bacterium]
MRYGFVIDQRRCIGCHACTVACKEENRVPLGAFRTWVKYIERGTFPNTRRFFSVLRCNHCDAAPCVTICPTVALYRRDDGIVDFDGERCIGCKSCMQACPYDALYIDPDTGTAAKCNYCAHRVEVGLEPACVIVCPEQAIIAGDLDDPASRIAAIVAREAVQVRKAEQGTRPKVFYLGADASALVPELQAPAEGYLWAERPRDEVDLVALVAAAQAGRGPGDGTLSRPVYDAPHLVRPWGWKVAAYLWTKSIAAGALLVGAFAGSRAWGDLFGIGAPALSLFFLAVTTALLIADLKRPGRFAFIVLKPNWRSWLVWGAWILMAFGGLGAVWLVAGATGRWAVLHGVLVPAVLLALATAGYSACLFGQAEGRAFWQSPLVLPQLTIAAVVAGAAALSVMAAAWPLPGTDGCRDVILSPRCLDVNPDTTLWPVLFLGLIAHAVLLGLEMFNRHPAHDASLAARLIWRGGYRRRFWGGVVLAGVVLPVALLIAGAASDSTPLSVLGALLALAGLWVWEDLWVRAGQSVPLS